MSREIVVAAVMQSTPPLPLPSCLICCGGIEAVGHFNGWLIDSLLASDLSKP